MNVTPPVAARLTELLNEAGFDVDTTVTNPLHLLEPRRLIADEGALGAARFVSRVAPGLAGSCLVLAMRAAMHDNADHLLRVVTATAVHPTEPGRKAIWWCWPWLAPAVVVAGAVVVRFCGATPTDETRVREDFEARTNESAGPDGAAGLLHPIYRFDTSGSEELKLGVLPTETRPYP
ncbi:MAG: hypothetical protein IPH29_08475 [Candidatus Microthrix sp.]|nr:hypothetical protein [Candidatus Microthrix sp.]